jgi:transposase
MYIRKKETANKKTGAKYTKHVLVESYRDGETIKQRTVMTLGKLEIDRREWKKLAHALESIITGKQSLLDDTDSRIWKLAEKLYSNEQFTKRIQKKITVTGDNKEKKLLAIDINDIQTTKTRSLGTELIGQWAWEQLGFGAILKGTGLTEREISVARALIFNKLIEPGSEKQAYEWFKMRSALGEMPGADITGLGKDMYYTVGDKLYDKKERIETLLYSSGRKLYPHSESTIFLYDLTNTYMEGACLGNGLAKRGHCKSKRNDCPLITLSLVVDGDGMPIACNIYKGNQSEPETLAEIIERIEATLWGGQMPIVKPTFAMDRGIATADNVDFLKGRGYPYVIIRREDESEKYRDVFQNERGSFKMVGEDYTNIYGDICNVYVRKAGDSNEETAKILCISDGKAAKEEAIDIKKEERFRSAIGNFNKSIRKGTIRKPGKIMEKLKKIFKSNKSVSGNFEYTVNKEPGSEKIIGVEIIPQAQFTQKLYGCYVIETTHTELNETDVWNMYMTLNRVESAFRMMKSELGFRPVHHQKETRTAAHLFISVLAYHLLAIIERRLLECNIHKQWDSLRKTLSTFTRNTVIMRDDNGNAHHIRVSNKPENAHSEIFDCFHIDNLLEPVYTQFNTL